MDPFIEFKATQRKGWASFAPMAVATAIPAANLVRFAGVRTGQAVLDAACGTGVVAVTAARLGARVSGLDLTPELLEVGRENARIARVEVDWKEGDVEALPYRDQTFDVVLSQFGHMFGPRPDVVTQELLRVLKPGGTLAFSTWPPELLTGRMFALTGRYGKPPPPGAAPPFQWGDPNIVRERLGDRVTALTFDRGTMLNPALSPAHHRVQTEQLVGPVKAIVENAEPEKLSAFRSEYDALAEEYFAGNALRMDYLMTRAVKR